MDVCSLLLITASLIFATHTENAAAVMSVNVPAASEITYSEGTLSFQDTSGRAITMNNIVMFIVFDETNGMTTFTTASPVSSIQLDSTGTLYVDNAKGMAYWQKYPAHHNSVNDKYTTQKVKRQVTFNVDSMCGPNRETCLSSGNRILVYLTGFNADRTEIQSTQTVMFSSAGLIVTDTSGDGVLSFDTVMQYTYYPVSGPQIFNSTMSTQNSGPGVLYTSTKHAVFTDIAPIQAVFDSLRDNALTLIAPILQQPGRERGLTNLRFTTFRFGKNVTAYEGADITFNCKVIRGCPEPTVQFFFGDQLLNESSPGFILTNDTLTVTDIALDDSGDYRCVAGNGIPPPAQLTSTLTVRRAVAPRLRPYWFPFPIEVGQPLVWPDSPPIQASVDTQSFHELIFACRVEGRPKAEVMWTINGLSPCDVVQNFTVNETRQGRSVLIVDITDDDQKMIFSSQRNTIQCTAMNTAGSTSGSVVLSGSYYNCMEDRDMTPPCSTTCGFGTFRVVYTCDRTTNGIVTSDVPLSEVPPQLIADDVRICVSKDANQNIILCPNSRDSRDSSTTLSHLRMAWLGVGRERKRGKRHQRKKTEFRWNTTEWTDCSRTCGGGSQTRNVTCLELKIPVNNRYLAELNDTVITGEVDESMCIRSEEAGMRPTEQQLCNTFPCFFKWRKRPFGQCGDVPVASDDFQTCKFRHTFCYNEDPGVPEVISVVNDTFCDDLQQPSALTSCDRECPYGIWMAGPWSNCSESCGFGTQTRSLQCLSPKSFQTVPNNFCLPHKRPATTQQCFIQNCPGVCIADEDSMICPFLARLNMCNTALAGGDSGMRCCYSCRGMGG